jgi:hypothetical protein
MKYLAIIGFVGASAASCILANSAANAGGLLDDVLRRVGASYAASAHRGPWAGGASYAASAPRPWAGADASARSAAPRPWAGPQVGSG